MKKTVRSALKTDIGRICAALAVLTALTTAITAVFYDYLRMRLFLLWNMFLAGLPLVFALLLLGKHREGESTLKQGMFGLLWLIFFPNAPYMLTDLIHLSRYSFYSRDTGFLPLPAEWLGLLHLLLGIMTGCSCGMLSLFLLHRLVEKSRGAAAGWIFIGFVCSLSGAAIYVGRFMRFNTWDVMIRPVSLVQRIIRSLSADTVLLYGIFAAMTAAVYLLFYACMAGKCRGIGKPRNERPARLRP